MLYQDRYVVEFEKESHASEHPNTGALQLYCIRQLAGVKFDDIAVGWVSNRDYKVDLDQEKRQVPYPRDTIRAWFCAALHLKNPTEFLAPMRKVFTDEEVRQGFLWAALPRYGGEAGVNTTLHAANAMCDGKPVLECFLDTRKRDVEPLFRFDPVKDNDAFVTNLCRLTVGNGYGLPAEALNRFPAVTRAKGVRALQALLGVEDLFVEATEEPFQRVGLKTRATPKEDLAVILVARMYTGTMTLKEVLDYWRAPIATRGPLETTLFSAEVFSTEFATLWIWLAMNLPNPKGFTERMHHWVDPEVLKRALETFVRVPPHGTPMDPREQARLATTVDMIMSGEREKTYFDYVWRRAQPDPEPEAQLGLRLPGAMAEDHVGLGEPHGLPLRWPLGRRDREGHPLLLRHRSQRSLVRGRD